MEFNNLTELIGPYLSMVTTENPDMASELQEIKDDESPAPQTIAIQYPVSLMHDFPDVEVSYNTRGQIKSTDLIDTILGFYDQSLDANNVAAYQAKNPRRYTYLRPGMTLRELFTGVKYPSQFEGSMEVMPNLSITNVLNSDDRLKVQWGFIDEDFFDVTLNEPGIQWLHQNL